MIEDWKKALQMKDKDNCNIVARAIQVSKSRRWSGVPLMIFDTLGDSPTQTLHESKIIVLTDMSRASKKRIILERIQTLSGYSIFN